MKRVETDPARLRGSPNLRAGLRRLSALLLVAVMLPVVAPVGSAPAHATSVCGKRYVAGGDDIPAGNTISSSQTFPSHLIADHMAALGWCSYNTAQNGTTSATYISGGQLATAWNRQPDFITLTVGEQDTPMVNLLNSCFDDVKNHDFSGANACAANILANTNLYSNLNSKLTTILQQYKMIMAGRPWLVVAVTGYPNLFPQASDVVAQITGICTGVIDSLTPCEVRWNQLPPALTTIDKVVQKLNTTIQNAVAPFNTGYQGRFIFVNPYSKFMGHEMKMDVTLKLDQVCHFCGTDATYEDSHTGEENFGSGSTWFQAGSDGTQSPTYLLPADQFIDPPVVIEQYSQTTSGMGIYPNDTGNKCISDLIWEAVKVKLGVPQPPNTNICQ
ncbi:MAG: hypothetical protein JWO59_1171 [Chloroflexi bacterium]|nr:hypothetical protein [Chloroflexota bacterium]